MGTEAEAKERLQKGLKSLLDDPEGAKCMEFESYLKQQGHSPFLEFIWACKGMRALVTKDNGRRNKQLVTCLYRQYILNGTLSTALSNTTFLKISERMSKNFGIFQNFEQFNIFNEAEEEVENHLALVIYPLFLEDINWDSEGVNSSSCIESNSKTALRCDPVINEDGLPPLISLDGRNFFQSTYPNHLPNKDPETFAKELSEKLEAWKEVMNHEKPKMCPECQEEEFQSHKSFSVKLATAIEEKLVIHNTKVDKKDEHPQTNNGVMEIETQEVKKKSLKLFSNSKKLRSRKHPRKKKNGFLTLKNLCGFHKRGKDDSVSLLSFSSISSTN